jgi:hypothetical protein
MAGADQVEHAATRRARTNKRRVHGAPVSLEGVVRSARKLPQRLQHELDDRPAVVVAAVAGAAFVAGGIFGSRLGRAVLVALLPVGLEYLLRAAATGEGLTARVTGLLENLGQSS